MHRSMARKYQWITFICMLFLSSMAQAATMIPFRVGGNINYSYGWTKSDNIESSRQTVSVTIQATGYIWRPWFITVGGGLSFGLYKSVSSAINSGSSSSVYSGNIGFRVFPQSRFPFSLAVSFSDSRLESASNINVGVTEYQNFHVAISQSYFARNGAFVYFTWNHNEFKSSANGFNSDAVNASYTIRKNKQSLAVSGAYNTSQNDNSSAKPESVSLSLTHSYLPTGTSNVNSFLSYNVNDPDSNSSDNESNIAQASSIFSWQPTHKPYSFTGAALVNRTESKRSGGLASETIGLNTQLGINYRFSRRLRMYANMGAGLTESNNNTITQVTGSGTISYTSEQYILAGFNYSFGLGLGLGAAYINSANDNTGTVGNNGNIGNNGDTGNVEDSRDSVAVNSSFGHSASRNFVVGRASSMSLGFSQSMGAGTSTDATEPNFSLGHSINTGWNTRHLRGSTYGSLSMSDSRTYSEFNSEFQQIQADLNHTRTINRVSALLASVALGWSRQVQEATVIADPAFDNLNSNPSSSTNYLRFISSYRNSRLFGIYPLRLLARLRYTASNLQDKNEGINKSTVEGDAKFSYRIGLLTTSLTFDATYNLVGTSNYGANFQISRAF